MNNEHIKKIKELFGECKNSSDGNDIYDNVIIGKNVKMGKNNLILPGTIIVGDVEIGNNNVIGPHVAIGTPPQHTKYYQEGIDTDCKIKIGDKNVLREFVTVHSPTSRDTIIGNECFFMANSHVSHDTQIGNNVVLGNSCAIGGHSTIMNNVFVGLNSAVHQFATIGAHAMIGMNSTITKDVPPFLVFHNKYNCYKLNEVGMLRNNFNKNDLKIIYDFYNANGISSDKLEKNLESLNASGFSKIANTIKDFGVARKRELYEINIKYKPSE
ncbi:MAG: acyl-[acyl-carrier-protein]--UDP-N-acetylglucosamine O-acyltransferase [Nanoarchaeota archaeon]|nr:acyl-[acyl-carrier-protein]--UDP-N-acetylglucosamine O-acyltransferase [Nanoarchaeota archaeon]MBU4124206.1 acyl-[acyl-carrier-protein]--UDP-N-acetylglucosamine O-acyltransferase [Nanoarchaeota archaeon]